MCSGIGGVSPSSPLGDDAASESMTFHRRNARSRSFTLRRGSIPGVLASWQHHSVFSVSRLPFARSAVASSVTHPLRSACTKRQLREAVLLTDAVLLRGDAQQRDEERLDPDARLARRALRVVPQVLRERRLEALVHGFRLERALLVLLFPVRHHLGVPAQVAELRERHLIRGRLIVPAPRLVNLKQRLQRAAVLVEFLQRRREVRVRVLHGFRHELVDPERPQIEVSREPVPVASSHLVQGLVRTPLERRRGRPSLPPRRERLRADAEVHRQRVAVVENLPDDRVRVAQRALLGEDALGDERRRDAAWIEEGGVGWGGQRGARRRRGRTDGQMEESTRGGMNE
eukprot:31125-Pelagococcus_subviridis.AAC.6